MDQSVATANTPAEFADCIMNELGRWAAENCPLVFNPKIRTSLFSFLYKTKSPIEVKFTSCGHVIIKIHQSQYDPYDNLVVRFVIANPALRDNMVKCFDHLNDQDFSDFNTIREVQKIWKRSL